MCQLQCELDEGIGARPALLDQPFAKGVKREGVQVHIIRQKIGAAQGSLYDLLTLQEKKEAPVTGEARQNGTGQNQVWKCAFHILCDFSGKATWKPWRGKSTASLPHPGSSGETESGNTVPAAHETVVECNRTILRTGQATSSELGLCVRNFQGSPSPISRSFFGGSRRRGYLLYKDDGPAL